MCIIDFVLLLPWGLCVAIYIYIHDYLDRLSLNFKCILTTLHLYSFLLTVTIFDIIFYTSMAASYQWQMCPWWEQAGWGVYGDPLCCSCNFSVNLLIKYLYNKKYIKKSYLSINSICPFHQWQCQIFTEIKKILKPTLRFSYTEATQPAYAIISQMTFKTCGNFGKQHFPDHWPPQCHDEIRC